MDIDIKIIETIVNNINDIELVKEIMKCGKYTIIHISRLFSAEQQEIFDTLDITKNEVENLIKQIVVNKDNDKIVEAILSLNGFYLKGDFNKENIINNFYSILEQKQEEPKIDTKEHKPLFNEEDDKEETLVNSIDLSKYFEIEKLHGKIYVDRLKNNKKQLIRLFNEKDNISTKYKTKIINRIKEIYNLDSLLALVETLENKKLMDCRTDKETYMIIKAMATSDRFYTNSFKKVFNNDLVLENRTFDDIVDIIEEIYDTRNNQKLFPEAILLSDYVLKNRTGKQAIQLNNTIKECKDAYEAHAIRDLIANHNIENITFEDQLEAINKTKKCKSLKRKEDIVVFYTQTLFNNQMNNKLREIIADKITELDSDDMAEYYTNYMIKICRNTNLSEEDVMKFYNNITAKDTAITMQAKSQILDSVSSSIYTKKEEIFEYFNILENNSITNNPKVDTALNIINKVYEIEDADTIEELIIKKNPIK